MEESDAIYKLIDKIQKGLPEIKSRSISLIATEDLPKFKGLPGVLLTWINDNNTRSELLFKVLTILSYFCKSTDGLVLLEQYEATQFFRELRLFLLSQQSKQDQYINILEVMIKSLMPLRPQTASVNQEQQKIEYLQESNNKNSKNDKKEKEVSSLKGEQSDLLLSWTVSREILGKKQEDQLYALMMELRHGKRQLQLQWLKRIHELVRYWGYKWFRFRSQLVSELTEQFQKSKFKWLIVQILASIVRGVSDSAISLQKGDLDFINISTGKASKPQKQQITLCFKSVLFQSIYSSTLIEDLIASSSSSKNKVWQWVLYLPFKYSPKFFTKAFEKIVSQKKISLNLSVINKQLQFYCANFSNTDKQISELICSAAAQWNLDVQSFPVLVGYLRQVQKNSSFKYISKYQNNWQLGSNLHNIVDCMSNLERGIQGISLLEKGRHFIGMYIDCLLTLGVAVEKQDPVMKYYSQMKNLIIRLSRKVELIQTFYQEILTAVNSHNCIKYGSKQYIRGQLAMMVLAEEDLFNKLFSASFAHKDALVNWIQVVKRLVLGGVLTDLDRYAVILYCLSYHKEAAVTQISKFLLQKTGRNGKMRINMCKIFSKSEEERNRVCEQLFGDFSQLIVVQLVPVVQKTASSKKLLKINHQTIENYSNIILNKTLQQQVRMSGAQQLLQTVERMELNEEIVAQLAQVSKSVFVLLKKYESLNMNFVSLLVQLNHVLNNMLSEQNRFFLKLQEAISIVGHIHSPRIIQILLQRIYCECFQNPFSSVKQRHFTCLLYPHIAYVQMDISQQNYRQKQIAIIAKQTKENSILQFPNYQQTQSIQHFAEWSLFQMINQKQIRLSDSFVSIVQKQIGGIIHANKSYINLNYLQFVFILLKKHKVTLPQKIIDFSSPLLNSLLSKDQSSLNSVPIANILSIIGCKRAKQLQSILLNNPNGYWKYILMANMPNLQIQLLQNIVKGLLGINYGREATQILRIVLLHGKTVELNQNTQSILLSSALKFIRQDADQLLRQTAFCFLIQFFGSQNLQCEGINELFSSIASLLLDEPLHAKIFILAANLIRIILSIQNESLNQGNILKIVISKISLLLTIHVSNRLIYASVFEVISSIILKNQQDLLGGLDVVDLAMTFMSNSLEKREKVDLQLKMMLSSIFDFLYLWTKVEKDLPKYLLSSTRIINYMLNAYQVSHQSQTITRFCQSLSRLWLQLSSVEEDLFVYKLNQLISTSTKGLFSIICSQIDVGGSQYIKMIGWTLIIWTKNRQQIEGLLGQKIAKIILSREDSYLIKWFLPFSIDAKRLFLNSTLLQTQLKQSLLQVENRIIRDSKQKKKKNKIFSLEQKQEKRLIDFLSLLSALFYWGQSSEIQLQGGENIKKILLFLQKFYCAGQWQEKVTKSYLKTMTNLALSVPFANCCGSRLSENSVMIQQLIGSVSKSEVFDGSVRISLRIMSVLINIESVRSMILRARIIEQLFARLCKSEQRGDLSLQYAMEIIDFFLCLSRFKQANIKLLTDKKMLQILLRLIKLGKFSIMEEKIVNLLGNLACFKHNKSVFMSNREIHKVILGLLEDDNVSYHLQLLNLLYNIIYKNSAALKMYRRPEVLQVIQRLSKSKESQTIKYLLQALQSDQA